MYTEKMKEARKNMNFTQANLAEKMNMTQQQYQKYESGLNELPIRYLKQFCELCNVSADYLLDITIKG